MRFFDWLESFLAGKVKAQHDIIRKLKYQCTWYLILGTISSLVSLAKQNSVKNIGGNSWALVLWCFTSSHLYHILECLGQALGSNLTSWYTWDEAEDGGHGSWFWSGQPCLVQAFQKLINRWKIMNKPFKNKYHLAAKRWLSGSRERGGTITVWWPKPEFPCQRDWGPDVVSSTCQVANLG